MGQSEPSRVSQQNASPKEEYPPFLNTYSPRSRRTGHVKRQCGGFLFEENAVFDVATKVWGHYNIFDYVLYKNEEINKGSDLITRLLAGK
jgi:hypothetical protein